LWSETIAKAADDRFHSSNAQQLWTVMQQ